MDLDVTSNEICGEKVKLLRSPTNKVSNVLLNKDSNKEHDILLEYESMERISSNQSNQNEYGVACSGDNQSVDSNHSRDSENEGNDTDVSNQEKTIKNGTSNITYIHSAYSGSELSGYASSYGSTWSKSDEADVRKSNNTITSTGLSKYPLPNNSDEEDYFSDSTPLVSNHFILEEKSYTKKRSMSPLPPSTPPPSSPPQFDIEARYKAPLSDSPFHAPTRKPESAKRALRKQIIVSDQIIQERGVKQAASCRDMFFSLSFIAQLIIVVFLGMSYGPDAFSEYKGKVSSETLEKQAGVHFTYANLLVISWCCGTMSILISILSFLFMSIYTRLLIPIGLFLSMAVPLIWSVFGFVYSPKNFNAVIGLCVFSVAFAHCFIVWDKIPVATANLYTALFAARTTRAIIVLSLVVQVVALTWFIIYFLLFIGLYDSFLDNANVSRFLKGLCYVSLGTSFFWTMETLMVRMMFDCT